jgi:Gametolysin peptidase M11
MFTKSTFSQLLLFSALSSTFPGETTAARHLRAPDGLPPGLAKKIECTVLVSQLLHIDPTLEDDEGEEFECELDPEDAPGGFGGLAYPLVTKQEQKMKLREMVAYGDLVPGQSRLSVDADIWDGKTFTLPDHVNLPDAVKNGPHATQERRALAEGGTLKHTGDKPILVVRVTDSTGRVYAHNAATMGDNIFGTNGDKVNLKSQMYECSLQQLNIIPGKTTDSYGVERGVAPGVVEVTIDVPLENTRSVIRNAVTTKVQELLGITLPGPYQQVMYNLHSCVQDCGWAAYAYINSWNSVYQAQYYYMVGVQMHELGHNFGLAHSGGLDGQTYTDHTCLMVRHANGCFNQPTASHQCFLQM